MRLHVLSDLHFDVRRASWRSLAARIPTDVGDVLVLAGDILCMNDVAAGDMLQILRGKAREVVYVLGNHEHYYGAFETTRARAARLCAATGVTLLDGAARVVAGRRFVGGTLWFRYSPEALPLRPQMMDFQLIEAFEDAVYRDNARQLELLGSELRHDDLVVTHHLPAWGSVAPRYRSGPSSVLNPFFLCDCQELIEQRQPALWIHGHTHDPCDHTIGATRVVCNPIGYPREQGEDRVAFFVDV
jgi:Icc-related predicted phosphoesterase